MAAIWNLPRIEFIPFQEIEERRPVILVTNTPAWDAVKNHLHLPISSYLNVLEATKDHWDRLLSTVIGDPASVIYAVGGGLSVDAAKYMATRFNCPLVCLPTALTVDAFLTPSSGIRQDQCVRYIDTKPPERIIVDFEIITAAPLHLRAIGITDVLSIATGCWDWKLADDRGKNPPGMEFIPWVYQSAQSILQGTFECAEAAGRGDQAGLKQLLDCLALEVQLCNQIGHARPEEGSEHYFAYCIENLVGPGLPHGNLVGPGILEMAELQGQDTQRLMMALRACHVPLNQIPAHTVAETIWQLPEYVYKHHLPYGIAHEIEK